MRQIFLKLFLLAFLSGCASMTEEYWQAKWEELPEDEKELYLNGERQGEGLPYAVCDLTDCIFIWVY